MKAGIAYMILFGIIAMVLLLATLWLIPDWTLAGRIAATAGWSVGAALLSYLTTL